MQNERDFKGIWIPKEIWLSKDLSVTEKIFLAEIDSLDGSKGCYASNDYFADFFALSKDRCKDIISSLEKKGRVEVILNKVAQNKDRRVIRGVWAKTPRPSGQKRPDGIGENAPQITKHIAKQKDSLYADPLFIEFWNLYPKKEGKGDAWKEWLKIHVEDKNVILDSVKDHIENHDNWKPDPKTGDPRDGGRFIPNPATFLNQRRFEDEVKKCRPSKVAGKYAGV